MVLIVRSLKRLEQFITAPMKYDPLSEKELLQHQLNIIHANTAQEEEPYLAEIRANIAVKWESTKDQIDTWMAKANAAA